MIRMSGLHGKQTGVMRISLFYTYI